MPANQTFSERLETALVMRDIKIADFARMAGLDRGTISNYLSGRYAPKADKLSVIAQLLNVSEVWLLGYGDNNPEKQMREYIDPNNPDFIIDPSIEVKVARWLEELTLNSVFAGEKVKPEELAAIKTGLSSGLAIAYELRGKGK